MYREREREREREKAREREARPHGGLHPSKKSTYPEKIDVQAIAATILVTFLKP